MTTLTTKTANLTGVDIGTAFASCASGDKFVPGDQVRIIVFNTDGSDHTVTVDSVAPNNYGGDTDVGPITVTAGHYVLLGPFPAQRFASASDGLAALSYSATTGMKIAVIG